MKTCNGEYVVDDNFERVIVSKLTRIGDRIMMAVGSKDEGWAKRAVLNGVQGTVIGITRYKHYQSRIGIYKNQPGVYEGNGAVIVRWDTGVFDKPSMHDVVFVEPGLKELRLADSAYNNAFELDERTGDLPDLPFWELDRVRLVPGHQASWDDCDELVVSYIDYNRIGEMCNDGVTPMPMYQVEPYTLNRGRISVRADDLILIERGNVWWWEHDKSKVKFADLKQEVSFHKQLGLMNEVRCPQTKNYHWPKEHVLEAAKLGMIDALQFHNGFFGSGQTCHAYKIQDRDLSRRANAALIEGFSNGNT